MPSRTAISRAVGSSIVLRPFCCVASLRASMRSYEVMNDAPSSSGPIAPSSAPPKVLSGTELLKSAISTEIGSCVTGAPGPRASHHVSPSSASTPSADVSVSRRVSRRTMGSGLPFSSSLSISATSSAVVAYRASGSGWMHRVMMRSSASGIDASFVRAGGGASRMRRLSSSNALLVRAARVRPSSRS